MRRHCDLLIVGAGAAGLAAAVSYARNSKGLVIMLDANDEAGKKIAATGNGRCNLTNTAADGYARTKAFFESLGVIIEADGEGRAYPLNRQAASVRRTLITEIENLGAELLTATRVSDIQRCDDRFAVSAESKAATATKFSAGRVIIAAGGQSMPRYGNLGDGFRLAGKLGHSINSILPVLVPVVYGAKEKQIFAKLKGVRARARVRLMSEDAAIADEIGEVQFTDYGISGICVFNLSRHMRGHRDRIAVRMDFAPEMSESEVVALLNAGRAAGMNGLVNSALANCFDALIAAGNDGEYASGGGAAALVKRLTIPISGTKGWKEAQVTSGGVPLTEVCADTLESIKTPGLYFAGEVLDYDGPSGGYNLDWAWNTGITAGEAAAREENGNAAHQ
jgi:predicted Rossmann fold flavoprotein